ncbi:hypothetical protein SAMN05880590_105171 [Rhizobium sp. RU35A]|uniref:Uncharacterized protein n=1 Tax=Rhizobium straminoryzae TaxID=1387186 RepID=A0A549ST25_9HYPH|nr:MULTISPECIES: CrpP-related protein [Rhizobium]TRL32765.1 hypothetical protein FNA46_23320 [Rhizobium straminoryzae]SIQ56411.1 hypothetical protein SAMN05880590_105171 [Rhizobium sp. RU35A]
MNIESLLECQERGARARILGAVASDNPYLLRTVPDMDPDTQQQMREAWAFGWTIEDAMRRIDTGFYGFLIRDEALQQTHSRVA